MSLRAKSGLKLDYLDTETGEIWDNMGNMGPYGTNKSHMVSVLWATKWGVYMGRIHISSCNLFLNIVVVIVSNTWHKNFLWDE